jgi:hypothetical protein
MPKLTPETKQQKLKEKQYTFNLTPQPASQFEQMEDDLRRMLTNGFACITVGKAGESVVFDQEDENPRLPARLYLTKKGVLIVLSQAKLNNWLTSTEYAVLEQYYELGGYAFLPDRFVPQSLHLHAPSTIVLANRCRSTTDAILNKALVAMLGGEVQDGNQ